MFDLNRGGCKIKNENEDKKANLKRAWHLVSVLKPHLNGLFIGW